MDALFKALGDPARREILDSLRRRDGQTLGELEVQLPMTRFGVMKHLKVLEDAHLITTRRAGRFKHHYLNALPLQQALDRWIEPLLAKPAARAILDLKQRLETPMTEKPDFVMQTYIRCSRDALWDALSDPAAVAHYHFVATSAERRNGKMVMYGPDGGEMLVCTEIEAEPKSRLVTTFEPKWDAAARASRVIYRIDEEGAHCRLTVEHYGLTYAAEGVRDGWARWAAGLKTWLETGEDARFGAVAVAAQ